MKLAIDIGGTHTDGVFLANGKIMASGKIKTSKEPAADLGKLIKQLQSETGISLTEIDEIDLGTTKFVNDLSQGKDLNKFAAIRLGYPNSTLFLPGEILPESLQKTLPTSMRIIAQGGKDLAGHDSVPINPAEIRAIAQSIKTFNEAAIEPSEKIHAIALSGIGSYVDPAQEREAEAILRTILPDMAISLSHQIGGGPDILGRESATQLNAMLQRSAQQFFASLQKCLAGLGFKPAIKIGLRDVSGGLVNMEFAKRYPIMVTASGPINSVLGALQLVQSDSAQRNAIVIDIGGTTSEVEWAKEGTAQAASGNVNIAGVKANLPNAKGVLSLTTGGDSRVLIDHENVSFGESDVPWVFGGTGEHFTLTDAAVAAGCIELGDTAKVNAIDKTQAWQVLNEFYRQVAKTIKARVVNSVRGSSKAGDKIAMPIIIVGGGHGLINQDCLREAIRVHCSDSCLQVTDIIIPEHAEVANAVGAADHTVRYVHEIACMGNDPDNIDSIATESIEKRFSEKGLRVSNVRRQRLPDDRIPYSLGEYKARFQVHASIELADVGVGQSSSDITKTELTASSPETSPMPIMPDLGNDVALLKKDLIAACVKTNRLPYRSLSRQDIADMVDGASFLGAGGGGPENIARMVGLKALATAEQNGAELKIIDEKNIPDDALIFIYGYLGTPSVAMEQLVSKHEGLYTIKKIIDDLKAQGQWQNDKPILFAAGEDGGANALMHLGLSSELNLASANVGFMTTARPGPQFMSLNIEKHRKQLPPMSMLLSNALDQSETVACDESNDLAAAGYQAFGACIKLGKSASLSFYPIEWRHLKNMCFKNTLTTAIAVGRCLREHGCDLQQLNKVMSNTEYGQAKVLASGNINVIKSLSSPMDTGSIWLHDETRPDEQFEILYQNEMLAVKKHNLATGAVETLEHTPTILTMVDSKTGQVIQISDLLSHDDRRQVSLIALEAPQKCYQADHMMVMGPEACHLQGVEILPRKFSQDSIVAGLRHTLYAPPAQSGSERASASELTPDPSAGDEQNAKI